MTYEIRAFISDIEFAKEKLIGSQALSNGEYSFRDHILKASVDSHDYNQEYLRIREFIQSAHPHKRVEYVRKVRESPRQCGVILDKQGFDSLEECLYTLDLGDRIAFSFQRRGWEYSLDAMQVYVEEIEGLPGSVEILAPEQPLITELLHLIAPQHLVAYDSVPKLMEVLLAARQFSEEKAKKQAVTEPDATR